MLGDDLPSVGEGEAGLDTHALCEIPEGRSLLGVVIATIPAEIDRLDIGVLQLRPEKGDDLAHAAEAFAARRVIPLSPLSVTDFGDDLPSVGEGEAGLVTHALGEGPEGSLLRIVIDRRLYLRLCLCL